MTDCGTLEGAVLDMEGAIALLYQVQEALLTDTSVGPARLKIEPQNGMYVFAFDSEELKALTRAIDLVGTDTKAVSKAFYALTKARAL